MKDKIIIGTLCALALISCSDNKSHTGKNDDPNSIKLSTDDEIIHELPGGEKFTIQVKSNGFNLLYVDNSYQFSLHKDSTGLGSLVSKVGTNAYDLSDTNGDFYPDILIDEEGTKELSFNKKLLKARKNK